LQFCGSLKVLTHLPLQQVRPPLPHGGLQLPPPELPEEEVLPELEALELPPPEALPPEVLPPEALPPDEPELVPPEPLAPEVEPVSSVFRSIEASFVPVVVDPPQCDAVRAATPVSVTAKSNFERRTMSTLPVAVNIPVVADVYGPTGPTQRGWQPGGQVGCEWVGV
jgi:hypothetical protein